MKDLGVEITIAMPGSVDTELRLKALDRPNLNVAEPNRKCMTPSFVANQIINNAEDGKLDIYLPWYYKLAVILRLFVPSYIDNLAREKYKEE
jgi:short-subunit dehydrogenase